MAKANAFYLGGTNEVSSKNYLCRLGFKLFLLEEKNAFKVGRESSKVDG